MKKTVLQRNRRSHGIGYVRVVLFFAFIMMIFCSVMSSAEGAEQGNTEVRYSESLDIFASNLSYDGEVHVIYAVGGELPEGTSSSNVRMLFSRQSSDLNISNAEYSAAADESFGSSLMMNGVTHEGVLFFGSRDISPETYGDALYARAYATDEAGNIYYGRTVRFGVLDYVYSRYSDGNATEEQLENYSALLGRGAAAQETLGYKTDRLVSSHGIRLVTEGGDLGGFSYGTYLLGDRVALGARDLYGDGYILSWKNKESGELIPREHSFTVTEESRSAELSAVYLRADFSDLPAMDLPVGSANSVSCGGASLWLSASAEGFGAHIIKDDSGNGVLKFTDANSDFGGSVNISAVGEGESAVLGFDMLVEDFSSDSTSLQLQLGGYMLQFSALEDAALKIYDRGSTAGYLDRYIMPGEWHSIRLVIDGTDRAAYLFIDGECAAKSMNFSEGELSDTLLIYGLNNTTLTACFDNIEFYKTSLPESIMAAYSPKNVFNEPVTSSSDRFQNAEILLDTGALDALKAMDSSLFSQDIYLWIAELYDPETSALYFSISGRDAYGYLPDIETVAQGYGLLSTLGLGGNTVVLNDEQKANLTAWIQTLQSNRDGYYYHPHWGVSIGNSRLSRDLGNSSSSFSASGSLAYRLFDDANYRLSGGNSGSKGTTVPSTYDNSLTVSLRRSSVVAVARAILASAEDNSSMPHHLRSEENLITYINDSWNSTCKLSGTHERHFCTDACVIAADSSDSYMKFENGRLAITRGYRCTSCHECAHTLGHSYAFGHGVTSMGSQIKAAGLGTPTVMYFYDIQENVQASLRKEGRAENGLWEKEITYNTISGLLKICGIPGTYGYEFLYAEQAINSAIECALFSVEDYTARGEAIVSIYNPFNAINGIMSNINNYGSDKEIRSRARAIVRQRAEELIENTTEKLACYLMPDGGYSYNMSGSCTHSQGQPVAIAGAREGDVNGTALALGTRGALMSCLGISLPAPFGGAYADIDGGFDLNGDGDLEDGFDLDGDGIYDTLEATCTHKQRFCYLITTKEEINKIDRTSEKLVYTFDEGSLVPEGGSVEQENGNRVLLVADGSSETGHTVSFDASAVLDSDVHSKIAFDMKVLSCNNTVSHQLFVDSGILRIDFYYNNGVFTFKNVTDKTVTLTDRESGSALSVNAREWFDLELIIYPEGRDISGNKCYGSFSVSQNGKKQTADIKELKAYSKIPTDFRMYSLFSSVNRVYYDNVTAYNAIKPGVYDGEYHFDTVEQKIADESILVSSPTFDKDTVYRLSGGRAEFAAYDYSTSSVIYNFNSAEAKLLLSDTSVSDRIDLLMTDAEGRVISGIYITVGENGRLSFFSLNGQILTECIPRTEYYPDGSSQRVTKERDMILSADLGDWVLVKLEYHHDMESPRLDVVVKYADMTKNGYKTATAAILDGIDVAETGANPYQFSDFCIELSSIVYIDDLFIRNVCDSCGGEHEYINKISSANYKGIDTYGHKEYYLSCRGCGARSADTFRVHIFEKNTDEKYKLEDATVNNAALYGESCALCGELSADTFYFGLPLEDLTKYNFSSPEDKEGEIPGYLNISTGGGKSATVMSETVADAVNYFLRISKKDASGSHSMTFRYQKGASEPIADKYIYEFDFRWGGASDMMNNRQVILVKMGAGSGVICPATYTASASGDSVTYANVKMYSGEWHSMKYLFVRNAAGDGYDGTAFADGKRIYTFKVKGNGVPYVNYETRWNLSEGGTVKHTDLELDIDRLKVTAVAERGHLNEARVSRECLISEATCLSPAVYSKICAYCGELSDETFTFGDIAGHDIGNVVDERFKICDTDLYTAATYYKSCRTCETVFDETFTVGEPLSHVFDESGVLPNVISDLWGFTAEPLSEGRWACVISEEVEGAVNYYLSLQKKSSISTHNLTFESEKENCSRYIYEFDIRWNYADRMRENVPILLKLNAGGTEKSYSLSAKADGTVLYHNGVAFGSGDWHTVRYEFTKNSASDGYNYVIKIDGKAVASSTLMGSSVPRVLYETRYGQTEKLDTDGDGTAETTVIINCTDISIDFDNIYCKAD